MFEAQFSGQDMPPDDGGMIPLAWQDLPDVARQLGDGDVHVLALPYQRQQKRQPLCSILAAYLGVADSDIRLVEGEFGRPALDPRHGGTLDFNWSHSGDLALIAIGRHFSPGIDIERLRDRPKALDIARQYFCADEFAMLASLPEADRSMAFLELWTAKEAVLKAIGRGIAFGLDRLHVIRDQTRPILHWLDNDDAQAWQLLRVEVDTEHVAALAWCGAARKIHHWQLPN